ncbi:hypothetical protein [Streptomyces spiralis]|uniref:hypothetical protein n=1 Tax=Streptomyces spiralis TaxID=66376 RepID=UPI0033C2B0FA
MPDHEKRRRVSVVDILGLIIGLACAVLVIGTPILNVIGNPFQHGDSKRPQPTPTATPTPTVHVIDNPALPDDEIQGYWYCWNSGDPGPHHLDHWVPNDHLCTWGELRSAGVTQ